MLQSRFFWRRYRSISFWARSDSPGVDSANVYKELADSARADSTRVFREIAYSARADSGLGGFTAAELARRDSARRVVARRGLARRDSDRRGPALSDLALRASGIAVKFLGGGTSKDPFPYKNSFQANIGKQPLLPVWKQFRLNLTGKDLSSVIGAFAWTAEPPVVFYLDDIFFER